MKEKARYTSNTSKELAAIRKCLRHKGLGTDVHANLYTTTRTEPKGTIRIVTFKNMAAVTFRKAIKVVIDEVHDRFGLLVYEPIRYRSEKVNMGYAWRYRSELHRTAILTYEYMIDEADLEDH